MFINFVDAINDATNWARPPPYYDDNTLLLWECQISDISHKTKIITSGHLFCKPMEIKSGTALTKSTIKPERVEIVSVAHDGERSSATGIARPCAWLHIATRRSWLHHCRYLSAEWRQTNAKSTSQPTLHCGRQRPLGARQLLQLTDTII